MIILKVKKTKVSPYLQKIHFSKNHKGGQADTPQPFQFKTRFWHTCFPVKFSKLLRTTFLQNTTGRLLLNADNWKSPYDCWLRIALAFSWTFSWDVQTLASNSLLKSERNHQSSPKFLLINGIIFMFDHCWKGRKSFINTF